MNNYFLKFGLLLLLATVSTLIYFFTINSTQNISQQQNGKREYILKNSEIYGSNNEGNFSYKIFSKKAKTNDIKKTIYLEQLKIEYVSKPEIDWVIQSDNGQIISQTNVLALSGNVIIENKSKESPSLINTSYLEINPNTMTIATNRDVFITVNNNTIQTKGFNAQLRENKLNFSSNMASNVSRP
tara:strand:+ start:3098 stop:3652 length:555 start_codon:yes stop_codon:yes gene_type:complete